MAFLRTGDWYIARGDRPLLCEFCELRVSDMSVSASATYWVWAVKETIVRNKHLDTVCNRRRRNVGSDSKFLRFVDELQNRVPEPSTSTAGTLHDLTRCQS